MATKIHQNLLAGEWRESGHSSININPSDISDIVGEYSIADSSQVQAAIDGAQAAFREWSAVTPQQRHLFDNNEFDLPGRDALHITAFLADLDRVSVKKEMIY